MSEHNIGWENIFTICILTCPFNDDAQHCWSHALDQLVHHPGEVNSKWHAKNIRCNIRGKKVNVVIDLNINRVLKNLSYQNIFRIFSNLTELL